jgi:hypothetical protein
MSEALRDFDLGGNDVELDGYIDMIDTMSADLREDQVTRLFGVLAALGGRTVEYGADFDLKEEVQAQIQAVRAMRDAVMPNGVVRVGTPAREVKEVVTASSTLLTTLMKMHERVMSFDRSRAIEEAVTATIRGLPEDAQKVFFSQLEQNLSAIE